MNAHQKHMHKMLTEAADKLRAVQIYSLGQGAGHTGWDTDAAVTVALAQTWTAVRLLERAGTVHRAKSNA